MQAAFDFTTTGRDSVLDNEPDVCSSRHKFAETSVEANKTVNKKRDRKEVWRIIRHQGHTFSKQIARIMDRPLNSISGRISELLAMDPPAIKIDKSWEPIEGCRVICDAGNYCKRCQSQLFDGERKTGGVCMKCRGQF